ncbi:type VII secretion protein EsaA [Sediminibacillus dalangtanensis]|uniref:Type VII secretion system accessory factor EsaA n=1 Tax=Sediminibacillus dalangtanensis TaxID=2729421 RepID=A0ABX7VV32_9BACI|nr:type VII secretion protein EsaA [Sediminibacillus dalangtanensis]QTN00547.1 type VII secretion protein EsaA [Sediminibacillus dalangtanensis]
MKKLDKRWLLFLLLILILGSSLSYLALNRQTAESETKETENTQRMAIALVNEDKGASLSGEALAFGDAFVESINNRDDHDWFVVSRGVAESGLERNTYDMMIVIPDDFSEKALSIESENPEQVVLNYKINASDNEQIKTEAEKTASNILNDFNRRIIDVYFASIVGNLQDAQDNIGEIISKQAVYTQTFNTEIHNPLENYTSQFGAIKDNTQISKDSFTGFQDIVKDFETQLAENAELDENYRSGMQDVFQLAENNSSQTLDFSQSINQFDESLNQYDVEQQLENLKQANININNQFAQQDNSQTEEPPVTTFMLSRQSVSQAPTNNIKLGAAALQQHLQESLAKVEATQLEIESRLNPDNEGGYTGKVKASISSYLDEAFEGESEPLDNLLEAQDNKARNYIKNQISKLPTLDPNKLKDFGLTEDTLKDIRKTIKITKIFDPDFSLPPDSENTLEEHITDVKNHLISNGVEVFDAVHIPKNENDGQVFTLELPEGNPEFEVTNLQLKLPGKKDFQNYTDVYRDTGKVNLSPNEEGKFNIKVTLKLKENSTIDIYQPIKWTWNLTQKNITKEDEPNTAFLQEKNVSLVASTTVSNTEGESVQSETEMIQEDAEVNQNDNSSEQGAAEVTDSESEVSDNPEEPETEETKNSEEPETEEPGSGNEEKPNDKTEEETEVEVVEIINNQINRTVLTPVEKMDDTTKLLFNGAINKVAPYYKLYSAFEAYYGFDISSDGFLDKLKDSDSLHELATEESLYYLFNEKDIKDLLKDYIVEKIVDDVTAEIRQPWDNLHSRITAYQFQVQQAKRNADKLVERINTTAKEAERLNKNLAATLADVEAWRENSLQLLESNKQLQTNQEEEQTAIMALDQEFQPLLTASQSLSEQAQGNLNSAETVYDTFDQIDEQATEIQESGTDLVSQAETLSVDMTNKLLADQEFAENFKGVLANSRVGERQNEELYDFLSNPVQASNQGTMSKVGTTTTKNTFTPYYLVLICFIVVLFTAYVISTINQKRREGNPFEAEKTLAGLNAPITLVTAGIGVLEGLVIGVVSGYSMGLTDKALLLLTGVIILLITGMLLLATYLLRQLKMIGMFLLLMVLSLYLFGKNAFGSGVAGIDYLKTYSPLHYVESLLLEIWQGTANYQLSLFIIIAVAVLGVLANLFVLHRADNEGDMDDESDAEAG